MKRRQLLAGCGVAIAGGGVALGTGAFTSVEANRTVDVSVANEDQAYLAISPTTDDNSAFAFQASGSNNELSLDFNDVTSTPGQGVNSSADFEFDNVFQVENQGTQEIDLFIEQLSATDLTDGSGNPPSGTLDVTFYPGSNAGNPLTSPGASTPNSVTLGTGSLQKIGVKIVTGDVALEDWAADVTIEADAT